MPTTQAEVDISLTSWLLLSFFYVCMLDLQELCLFLWYFDHHFFFVSSLQELDIMSHLEKKLQYVEEEKHRLECRLKNTELELKETQTSLEQSIVKRRVSKRLAIFFSDMNGTSSSVSRIWGMKGLQFFDSPGSILIHLFYSSVSSPLNTGKVDVTFKRHWTNFRPVENFRIRPEYEISLEVFSRLPKI